VVGDLAGDASRASTTFDKLPQVVKPGDNIFLNDGLVQLAVETVSGDAVHCRVTVGGPMLSHKGINLPNAELGISALTERDREWLAFALAHGVDSIGQSFVQSAHDVHAVREAARPRPARHPGIRQDRACARIAAHRRDLGGGRRHHGRARGDLGVEIPTRASRSPRRSCCRRPIR
jgi:pyruvate kinase